MKKIAFISSLLMLLFIGCQSSSSSDVSENHPLNPKVVIEDFKIFTDVNNTININDLNDNTINVSTQNGNINISGKIRILDNNKFYSKIIFRNIQLNLFNNGCEVNNSTFIPQLDNNKTVNFELNLTCKESSIIDNLNVNFEEDAEYVDINLKTIKKIFDIKYPLNFINIEKISNLHKLNSLSINPLDTTYNENTGLFEQVYSIHFVDKNGNPVPFNKVNIGVLVNPKVISKKGTLKNNSNIFSDETQNFINIDKEKNLIDNQLVILADQLHNDSSYLGGWIVQKILDSTHLELNDYFNGENILNISNLSYVIGDEKRTNICNGSLNIADFDNDSQTQTDSKGVALVTLKFDPDLIGKTVVLYANTFDENNQKIGTSLKTILMSHEGVTTIDSDTAATETLWSVDGNMGEEISGWFFSYTEGGVDNIYDESGNLITNNGTLLTNVPIKIKILTPDICAFVDTNNLEKSVYTNCNGYADFKVRYKNDGTCEVQFEGVDYEY